jgi:uncharacterized protein YbjT (DUF2867 family)
MTTTVLLIGARGYVGSQVLNAVLEKGKYEVKALIREGSKLSKDNVAIIRGDMMDKESLVAACQGVDVVINTANGYMSGHPEIDREGANNVVDAVKSTGVKRYIYCSILTADKADTVEHFHDKKLAEDYMAQQDVPYIALRPGAFLDQATDYLGDGIKRGDSFSISMWDKTVPIGMIHTADLAQLFADAIELPTDADQSSIDIGWSRPIAMQEVVSIVSDKLDRKIRCFGLPSFLRTTVIYTVGNWKPFVGEMCKMFNYFDTGSYVNSTELQQKFFGGPPTPEEVIGRYVDSLMTEKKAAVS